MTYSAFRTTNALEEFSFIAETDYTLTFTVYESDGVTPVDLGGGTIKWVLSPMGQPDFNILELDGVINTTSTFTVSIPAAQTSGLSGKFVHQPVITDFEGKTFRPAQGIITIIPRIPLTS